MDYKFTKAALIAATMCLSTNAIGQDWTGGSETLYFDFDRADNTGGVDLTKVKEVLQSCSVSSMSITGHTDTTGSQAYNQPLSERRAEKLASIIASWGLIDRNVISTRGAGENELALYTEDGVKEQLNRRAEVVFGFSQPCGIYYTAPAEPVYSEPVTVSEPVYSEPVTYSEPVYSEPVTYSEPVIYSDPAPVVTTPAPAPAPVVTAPTPAPVSIPAPVGAAGGNTALYVLGGLAVAGAAFIIIDDDDDDDDEPVSP